MTPKEITDQLQRIVTDKEFQARLAELTDDWSAGGVDVEAIEPILRFMEDHPSIDFGAPGALVHFVERFYGKGYEERLVESVKRKPTLFTVWMLNRVINGAKVPGAKDFFVAALQEASMSRVVDAATRQRILSFLERHSR